MIAYEPAVGSAKQTLNDWASRLAASLKNLTGVKPSIRWAGPADRTSPSAGLWSEFTTDGSGGKLYVGAAESSWRALAGRVLSATPSIEAYLDAKQVYVNLLEQSSEQKGNLSGTSPPNQSLEVLELRFPEQPPIPLLLGVVSSQAHSASASLGVLSGVELPITIRFASTHLLLQDLAGLEVGSAIEFDRGMDEAVEILVNGRLVARGDAVVVRGNYGVRITEVVSRRERWSTSYKVVRNMNSEIGNT